MKAQFNESNEIKKDLEYFKRVGEIYLFSKETRELCRDAGEFRIIFTQKCKDYVRELGVDGLIEIGKFASASLFNELININIAHVDIVNLIKFSIEMDSNDTSIIGLNWKLLSYPQATRTQAIQKLLKYFGGFMAGAMASKENGDKGFHVKQYYVRLMNGILKLSEELNKETDMSIFGMYDIAINNALEKENGARVLCSLGDINHSMSFLIIENLIVRMSQIKTSIQSLEVLKNKLEIIRKEIIDTREVLWKINDMIEKYQEEPEMDEFPNYVPSELIESDERFSKKMRMLIDDKKEIEKEIKTKIETISKGTEQYITIFAETKEYARLLPYTYVIIEYLKNLTKTLNKQICID